MATSEAPVSNVGYLGNGSAFLMPTYGNMPWFGYADLQAQMEDAQQAWAKGAGAFGGNNVPKYNGLPGSGPNGTFGGGFALQQPNVGGATYGKQAYSGGFDPFRGRGLLGGATPPGTTPPGTTPPGTTPPGTQPPFTPPAGTGLLGDRTREQYGSSGTPPATNPSPLGVGMQGATNNFTSTVNPGMGMHGVTQTVNGMNPKSGLLGLAGAAGAAGASNSGSPGQGWYTAANWAAPSEANKSLLARTLAAGGMAEGQKLQELMGNNMTAYHQAQNYYNAGGAGYQGVWATNYAAVAQNPEAYINAGIAKANGDGTYTMLKLQDPETQQWVPIEQAIKAGWANVQA